MQILSRLDSLSVEQLSELSKKDDAAGVLASFRLAQLTGAPMPEREALIVDGDSLLIVKDGTLTLTTVTKVIREGSFVSWNSSGGRARGRVEHVMTEGVLGVPDSDFSINAEPDDPAVLIRIWRQTSEGWAETETLVGHKMSTLTSIEPLNRDAVDKQETYEPPKGVQEAAQRALDWIGEGHAGSGFTDVGRARAAQLARGDAVSEETIRRIASYLARHQGDARAEGFNSGEPGFPSPGRVAWDAWGGDAGVSWANRIVAGLEKDACPLATQDVALNLANRAEAIEIAMYGPLNPNEPSEAYWDKIADVWDVTVEEAQTARCGNCAAFDIRSEMRDCISDGISDEADPYDVIEAGELGYCRAFQFKCASDRTCSAWIAGGPIADDREPVTLASGVFLRKEVARRFTLGPLYVPEFMDAHGEWTDADELQRGVWGWVQSGDRTIYLQHDREVRAGEWVEVMTMPQPWTVQMTDGAGEPVGEVTYPAGTVFLGVIWDDSAWEKIKRGELRGYSIGGFSDRVLADLPEEAARDGIDLNS